MGPAPHPRRILIVGGGPCGLVTLRNCLYRGDFEQVELVERREKIGGVWCRIHDDAKGRRPRWDSPVYPGLIGNVLPEFLSFSEHSFPTPPGAPKQPFPNVKETFAYLQEFSRPFLEQGRIRLNHEVLSVEEIDGSGGWRVIMRDWSAAGEMKVEIWDAVVITTVWFDNPYFPSVDGLNEELIQTGKIKHAKTWKGPRGYEGKRVMVIGNANSANDMAAQLAPVGQLPVYRSMRRVSIFPSIPDDRIEDVGTVTQYKFNSTTAGQGNITVEVGDRTIRDIDYVLFGTGYYPDVPYLRVLDPSSPTQEEKVARQLRPLTSPTVQPVRIPFLFRQVLYAHNPSLAFTGAVISFIPFAMADLTSTWLSLVWSGHIEIPVDVEDRLDDEQKRLEELHTLRSETDNPSDLVSFHFLGRYELPYAQIIRRYIVQAKPDLDDVLLKWDDKQDGRRFGMYATKLDSLYVVAGKEKPVAEEQS
ncbi:FAD/NAD(P)-binding domain-containing protein [Phlebopus sp. FC_14]|nr:FAD/NAD(P)-binding domain-containing protein [Phlebopus sp. FC_14]